MTDLVLRTRRISFSVERRLVLVCLLLAVLALALGLLGLCYGAAWVSPFEALAALAGRGDAAVVVGEWRAPRVAAAIVFGAALGLAGAVFQNLTRNALGSPDIIGLDAGAYTGALIVITLIGATPGRLAFGAVVGGLAAAGAIYLLSLSRTGTGLVGLRLVVTGIGVNATLTAVDDWIILRSDLDTAIAAIGWNAGSLNGVDWDEVSLPFAVIGGFAVLLAFVARAMHQASLGDDLAVTSGVPLNRIRLLLVVAGVGCTATVTAVAGPIIFVALAAPQIGRRLVHAETAGLSPGEATVGVPLLPAALTGAVLLLVADLIAQMLLAPVSLPVGVVTTVLGGCYLIWLLVLEVRRR